MNFEPDYTPQQMFSMGVFGGTYFRDIYSSVTKKYYHNSSKEFKFLKDIPIEYIESDECNVNRNYFKVKAGTSLKYWESKNWIKEQDPYGWASTVPDIPIKNL
jgi:hypothetical protein